MPGQAAPRAKEPRMTPATETSRLVLPSAAKATHEGAKASARDLAMNLITAGLGTGIFTLPWSTAGSSVVPAVCIIGFVLALNAWTISLIVEAGDRHQTFNLGALLGKLPGSAGRAAEIGVNIFCWISSYLCLVSYIIVIADCLLTSLPQGGGMHGRTFFVAVAAAVVLPLCFLDQRRLSFTSTVAVLATASIFGNIAAQYMGNEVTGSQPQACYFGLSAGSVAMFSAMMQTVVIQMCVLPMYEELEDRSPAKFTRIVTFSFAVLFVLCSLFAVVGYLSFGQAVQSNVLLNLPNTPWGHASKLSAAVAVAAVYPIIMSPMIAPLKASTVALRFGPGVANTAIFGIVAASMYAALHLHDLGFVNIVNGAMSCGAFVALSPSLVGLYLLGQRSEHAGFRGLMYCLIAFGLFFAVLGLLMTDNYEASLASACVWAQHGSAIKA